MTSKMLMTTIRSDDELTTQTSTKATTPAKSIPRRPLDLIPDENNPHSEPVPDPSVQHVYE